jgi:hypothetical protein
VKTRDDRELDEGGVTLSFADDQDRVRAVVHLAVARDAAGARAFVLRTLRGVAAVLPATGADEVAFGDPKDRFLVAAHGNIAYVVDAQDGSAASASSIGAIVKGAVAAGAPVFPRATVSLPATAERSAPVAITTSAGARYRLHASGGYVARGPNGPVIRPFAAGRVEVTAVVSDDLARVTVARAATVAR